MFEDLRGQVAVVTGGGRGLGLEIADALAEHGVHVALLDLAAPERKAEELGHRWGVPTAAAQADVTSAEDLETAVAHVADVLGGVPRILVNAAGIAVWADATAMPTADWRRVVDINLTGTFLACQAFARRALEAGASGTVVNISSMSAFVVNVPQHQAAYNASKAGVDQLTRSLAVEWISRGIRVNAISPGYFLSAMTRQFIEANHELGASWVARIPAGRMGDPSDLRGLVVFLASDASRYIVGESVVIDGGYSIV